MENQMGTQESSEQQTRLLAKLKHYLNLKQTRNLSLNLQLASHPDFHNPDITDGLLECLNLDPWNSNLPAEFFTEDQWNGARLLEQFDYEKVSTSQRVKWEASQNTKTGLVSGGQSSNRPIAFTTGNGKVDSRTAVMQQRFYSRDQPPASHDRHAPHRRI